MTLKVTFTDAIETVDRNAWQSLVNADNPFVCYDYLHALESSGATGEGTGWQPHHALVHNSGDELVGAAPLYIKDDSWGEFVFDFAWAEAHHQHGIPYYPKLVTAVPYTPVAGPRLLHTGQQDADVELALLDAITSEAEALGGSSWHLLFPLESSLERLTDNSKFIVREDCQFHWFNRDYTSFDHYLSFFRSSRRKKTRRERRKMGDAGLTIEDGEALLERARLIKSVEEIHCIRHAIAVAELALARIDRFLRPGVTENELWSILHQTNIAHGGEWVETRLLNSGPRTNPWMQECSDRVIEAGDLVALDTDMIGPNAYCADISRTFLCRPATPTKEQRRLYRLSWQQIRHNVALLQPGRPLRQVIAEEWPIPEEFHPYRYGFAHGVGMKDEYPFLPNNADAETLGEPDLTLEPGMVVSVESYIGAEGGPFGVKLEDQVLITDTGPELLSHFPYEDALLQPHG